MVGSRTVTALAGVLVSLLVSVVAWRYFGFPFLFLFVPFVPFLLRGSADRGRRPSVRECPVCGFRTGPPAFDYCPRDGHRLE